VASPEPTDTAETGAREIGARKFAVFTIDEGRDAVEPQHKGPFADMIAFLEATSETPARMREEAAKLADLAKSILDGPEFAGMPSVKALAKDIQGSAGVETRSSVADELLRMKLLALAHALIVETLDQAFAPCLSRTR
jgi:hypothetical protein